MHEPLKNCPFCGGDARHDAHADDCYFILHRNLKNSGADMSPALEVLAAWNRRVAPATMIGEPVFAFRRKGLDDFCTCTEKRYAELSLKPKLFETRIFYTTPQPTQAQAEKCAVCGDGNARLVVMRSCDVCGSDYAGQSESEVNVALERARKATQAQAGAVPLTDSAARSLVWSASDWARSESINEDDVLEIVRATEAAHGIKGGQHGAE